MSVVRSRPTGAHSAMAAMLDLGTALSDLAEIHGKMSRGASKQHIHERTFRSSASESCEDPKSLWGTALDNIHRALRPLDTPARSMQSIPHDAPGRFVVRQQRRAASDAVRCPKQDATGPAGLLAMHTGYIWGMSEKACKSVHT